MKKSLFALALFLFSFFTSYAQLTSTEELLREMQTRYNGKFYKHITFVQLNKEYKDSGQIESSVWYEAYEYPGKMRVDYGPTVGRDGYIFINDSLFTFKDGALVSKEKKINESMLLSGDIYCIPVPEVKNRLKSLGYNVSILSGDKWNGKSVYVIGAPKGDLHSRQIWIDRQFMYVVRQIIPTGDSTQTDIVFREHQANGKFYIEDEVRILENGQLKRSERYAEVNPKISLHDEIFVPASFSKTHWKSK